MLDTARYSEREQPEGMRREIFGGNCRICRIYRVRSVQVSSQHCRWLVSLAILTRAKTPGTHYSTAPAIWIVVTISSYVPAGTFHLIAYIEGTSYREPIQTKCITNVGKSVMC